MKQFRIIAKYYIGYGSNLKRLRSVKPEHYKVSATDKVEALDKLNKYNGRNNKGLSSGWIFDITDKARKYHTDIIIITEDKYTHPIYEIKKILIKNKE